MDSLGLAKLLLLLFAARSAAPYKFLSDATTHSVLEGDRVVIECSVEGLMAALPVLWLNNSFIFAMNGIMYSPMRGVTLDDESPGGEVRTYVLTIDRVSLADEGSYECQIPGSYRSKQIHTVTVNIPPEIERPDQTSYELEVGDRVDLACVVVEGKPDPTVTWVREGGLLPSGEPAFEGEEFSLENVTSDDSGRYRCVASNGFGDDEHEEFSVNVLFAPMVNVTDKTVHTGPGHKVSITCLFSGYPTVQVAWLYDGEDVNYNVYRAKTDMDGVNSYIATLTISRVTEEEFGEYTCRGVNRLGMAEETVTLSALPHSLKIVSDSQGQYSDQYTLEWTLSSVPDPIECEVTIQEQIQDPEGLVIFNETGSAMVPAQIGRDSVHPQKYTITGLHVAGIYTAQLKCRNPYGAVETPTEFQFQTSLDENLAPMEETTTGSIVPTEPKTRGEEEEEGSISDNTIGEKKDRPSVGESKGHGVALAPTVTLLAVMIFARITC